MKVPRRYILRWENEGKKPSEEHLKLLAKHLKVPLADLQDPRPHEAEYRSLEDRIVALEVETFGEAQG